MPPDYSIPALAYFDLAAALLLGRRRSFRALAQRLCDRRGLPARVIGRENIPRAGPAFITVNHYHSAYFWSPWIALTISAQLDPEIYWTVTNAWTFPGHPMAGLLRTLSHTLLVRLARVYGFNSMPPMPPAPAELSERAAAVRRVLQHARENPTALIGFAPEGRDQPGGVLGLPPAGAGRLALALARRGMPVCPAGLYEDADGALVLCFGPPYSLRVAENLTGEQADLQARCMLMRAIAGCLPEHLRGEFLGPSLAQ